MIILCQFHLNLLSPSTKCPACNVVGGSYFPKIGTIWLVLSYFLNNSVTWFHKKGCMNYSNVGSNNPILNIDRSFPKLSVSYFTYKRAVVVSAILNFSPYSSSSEICPQSGCHVWKGLPCSLSSLYQPCSSLNAPPGQEKKCSC